MDEFEARIAVLELAVMELAAEGAVSDPLPLRDAMASIRAGFRAPIDADERTVRRGALQLLADANDRFNQPTLGMMLRS